MGWNAAKKTNPRIKNRLMTDTATKTLVIITPRWERQTFCFDAHVEGVNVGYVNVRQDGRHGHKLDGLFVAEGFRGNGIAHALMTAVCGYYAPHDLHLYVNPFRGMHEEPDTDILDRAQLMKFYRSHGFVGDIGNPRHMLKAKDRSHGHS
jgi:GNAT superfamily N-acetyltransferase